MRENVAKSAQYGRFCLENGVRSTKTLETALSFNSTMEKIRLVAFDLQICE
jgi:hypothetical protein